MEPTHCVFNCGKSTCRCLKKTNVNHLACGKDFGDKYGLELYYTTVEHDTKYSIIGGQCGPKKGVVFKSGDVIIPEREFFDKCFRPEDIDMLPQEMGFRISPHITELLTKSLNNPNHGFEARYTYEVIRNLAHPPSTTNMGPYEGQNRLSQNAVTLIQSKLSISEFLIQKLGIFKHIQAKMALYKNNDYAYFNTLNNLSTCFQYILGHCQFSESTYEDPNRAIDRIMFNAMYYEGIGLVAVEEISHPRPIVIAGHNTITQIYTNAFKSTVNKDIILKEIKLKDMPDQYSIQKALRGGSANCLF